MSTHAKTRITVNPQAQMIVNGGDNDVLKRGDPSCNLGCDLRVFLDHSGFCPEMHAKVEGIITAGETAEAKDSYKQQDHDEQKTKANGPLDVHGNTFALAGVIDDDEDQITNSGVFLDKLMTSLAYKCGEKAELECQVGFAKSIQQDNCGRYQAGWYKCQSEYFGNAFEGFVNPFIWNKQTKGIQLTFRQGPVECWGHYGVALDNAAAVNAAGHGFANSDTPGECDAGVCYRLEGPCPARLSLICQQINAGSKGFETNKDYLYNNGHGKTEGNGSMTTAAGAALAQSQEKSQYANALTAGCDSEFQGIDVNGYLTCANVKNSSDSTARIMKWSVGCVSKCRPIKCLPVGGMGAQAFGLNLGTPAYLSGDLKTVKANATGTATGDVTLKADDVPLVCEASCLFNICGFNVPIFVDYLNRQDGAVKARTGAADQGIYNVETNKGSALICGMRPSRISGLECSGEHTKCFDKHILDCRVEGGLDEDEE